MNKVVGSCEEAIADIEDGATIMAGGFGLSGLPENLIIALRDKGVKDLTLISNNCGVDDWGLGLLLQTRQIKKMVATYVGECDIFEKQFLAKEIEVELNPQGTFAERIRAGGAGIGGFYTPTGVGTLYAEGRETRVIDGREYLFYTPLKAEFALIRAWKADRFGNLVYRLSAANFNPMMAAAAKVTIAEVEEILEVGEIDPNLVHTPGIYVQRVVRPPKFEKRIEVLRTRPRPK